MKPKEGYVFRVRHLSRVDDDAGESSCVAVWSRVSGRTIEFAIGVRLSNCDDKVEKLHILRASLGVQAALGRSQRKVAKKT